MYSLLALPLSLSGPATYYGAVMIVSSALTYTRAHARSPIGSRMMGVSVSLVARFG